VEPERGVMPEGYHTLLGALKERIRSAQTRAALSVNRELVLLYWTIGREIAERQEEHGWGAQVIARLSADLRQAFPDMKGFSPRNLRYMRAFAAAYPEPDFWQQAAANLPWGHVMRLLDTVPALEARTWYAQQAVEHGWSRAILAHHIDGKLYDRQGQSQTNFTRTLPAPQSDLAQQVLKDPYNFDVRRTPAYRIPFRERRKPKEPSWVTAPTGHRKVQGTIACAESGERPKAL